MSPSNPDPSELSPLAGREVLIGICGGIAAYKLGDVVSGLVQRGAGVTVAMTRAARKFIGPTTFEALTGRKVLSSLWDADGVADSPHIRLTRAADLTLIAPATANIIGKIASGIADDVVTTIVISAPLPVLLAPAMNDRMWANPIVQGNIRRLAELGYQMVGPREGWLACRTVGMGRMAEPKDILETAITLLKPNQG